MTRIDTPRAGDARTVTGGVALPVRPTRRTVRRLRPSGAFLGQLVSFGAVGGFSFVVDVGLYNLLRATVLDDKPIGAKIISVAVATAVAWVGNRFLTFRSRRTSGTGDTVREGILFALMNLIGLGIASACLFVSHYVLGFTSTLADNVAGNGIGLALGTTFRFVAYKAVVFRTKEAPVE
jgi:putative flippase GtrA